METTLRSEDISALVESHYGDGVIDLQREETYEGTHPKEVITCSLASGRRAKLLIKYDIEVAARSFGHRGGVAYEGRVYLEILPLLGLSVPSVVGSASERGVGWLALEYLGDAVRIKKIPDATAVVVAAEYAGFMHRQSEPTSHRLQVSFLTQYDASYYSGWADRAIDRWANVHPWIIDAHRVFNTAAHELSTHPRTLVHGEFYPKNILWFQEAIYPVDWESAACALGEIDLITLTDGWPGDVADACRAAYVAARWRGDPPEAFDRRLAFSEAYVQLRWLSEYDDSKPADWRLQRLRAVMRGLEATESRGHGPLGRGSREDR